MPSDRADAAGGRPIRSQHSSLAGTSSRAPSHPRTSAPQVEILRLVAAGLTNAQIAERLFISPRTVNAHLNWVYGKINAPNRGAAVRFAADHDLI